MTSRLIRLSHIMFQVSDAQKTIQDLVTKYRFYPFAARGLDGRNPCQVALRNGGVVLMVNQEASSVLYDSDVPVQSPDTVCNVSFEVEDVPSLCRQLLDERCQLLVPPTELHDDYGSVTFCVVKSVLGNVRHTLIDRTRYGNNFLPEFQTIKSGDHVPSGDVSYIDHVTYVCPRGTAPQVLEWYARCFGFKHFPLSVAEDPGRGFELSGPEIGLRLIAAESPAIGKMVLAESLPQEGINQVDLFLQHHKEGGIQHVGLFTPDIFMAAESMVQQGVRFTKQPPTYYSDPRKQQEIRGLGLEPEMLSRFGILLDSGFTSVEAHGGYLLQVFAEPLFSKDSFYLELIERQDAEGFGEGNIRALWKALKNFMDGTDRKEDEKMSSTVALCHGDCAVVLGGGQTLRPSYRSGEASSITGGK